MQKVLLIIIDDTKKISEELKTLGIYHECYSTNETNIFLKDTRFVDKVYLTSDPTIIGKLSPPIDVNKIFLIKERTVRQIISDLLLDEIGFYQKYEVDKVHVLLTTISINGQNDVTSSYLDQLKSINSLNCFYIIDQINNVELSNDLLVTGDITMIDKLKLQLSESCYHFQETAKSLEYWKLLHKYVASKVTDICAKETKFNIIVVIDFSSDMIPKIDISHIINEIVKNKSDGLDQIHMYEDIFAIGTERIMTYYMMLFQYYGNYKFCNNVRKFATNGIWDSNEYYHLPNDNIFNSKVQLTEHILHYSDVINTRINRIYI